jgi:AAA domain
MATKYKTLDELVAEVAPARCVQVWPRLSTGHPYLALYDEAGEVKRDGAGKPVFTTQKPVGNSRYDETDVWYDIAHHTEDRGGVLVIGLWGSDVRKEWDDNGNDTQIHAKLDQAGANLTNVLFCSLPKTKDGEEVSNNRKIDLGDRINLKVLVAVVRKNDSVSSLVKVLKGDKDPNTIPVEAVVIYEPNLDEDDLKYLDAFRKACPHVDVYIFHYGMPEKCGVEVDGKKDTDGWEIEFPPLQDTVKKPQEIIVDDLLIKGGIHVLAGRFETYKTMALIELCDAVLSKRPAFDHFKVHASYPILFLEEDMSFELFDEYCEPFGLRTHGERFRVKKPKSDIIHALDSPVLQEAVRGRILVLDTMLDFAKIKEAFQSGEWVTFMRTLRDLIEVHECVAILMTAHATKTGAKADNIDPSDYLKDSVTFGGKIDVGYGFKALANTSQILVERIKGRGFKARLQFTITHTDDQGNSNLDGGRFPVCQKPGEVTKVKTAGRKGDPDKQAKLEFLKTATGSSQEKADALNAQFNSNHPRETIRKWEIEAEAEKNFQGGLTA